MSVSSPDLRISVIIPTYNQFERLKATIQSVLDQRFAAAEIIVIDDGSTDRTPDIAGLFAGRLRYERTANGGQQRARNHGVQLSTGDWIALLDHDDIWHPDYLAEINALVRAHAVDATISNSDTRLDAPGAPVRQDADRFMDAAPRGYWARVGASPADRWSILARYDYASYIEFHPCQTSMFAMRRALYDALGGFDPRMRGNGAENLEFELRLLRTARVGLIWRKLVTMVRHDANASRDKNRMALDVVACLNFALDHHGLRQDERAIIQARLQKLLPVAISAAFLLRDYAAIRRYRHAFTGDLYWKERIKCAIAAGLAFWPLS